MCASSPLNSSEKFNANHIMMVQVNVQRNMARYESKCASCKMRMVKVNVFGCQCAMQFCVPIASEHSDKIISGFLYALSANFETEIEIIGQSMLSCC